MILYTSNTFVWIHVCPYVCAVFSHLLEFYLFQRGKVGEEKKISSNFPLILRYTPKSTREQSTHTQALIHSLFKCSLNKIVAYICADRNVTCMKFVCVYVTTHIRLPTLQSAVESQQKKSE